MLNVEQALEEFKRYVVSQSKANLTRSVKRNSGKLRNSIKGDVKVMPNSIGIYFEMEDYGQFVDQGVKGKTSSFKSPKSPFRFGTRTGEKGGLTKGIRKWVISKRIQFKDKKGRFISYEQTARTITRSIYNKGLKPTLFFTKPFEKAFAKIPTTITEKYGLDVEDLIKQIIKI